MHNLHEFNFDMSNDGYGYKAIKDVYEAIYVKLLSIIPLLIDAKVILMNPRVGAVFHASTTGFNRGVSGGLLNLGTFNISGQHRNVFVTESLTTDQVILIGEKHHAVVNFKNLNYKGLDCIDSIETW